MPVQNVRTITPGPLMSPDGIPMGANAAPIVPVDEVAPANPPVVEPVVPDVAPTNQEQSKPELQEDAIDFNSFLDASGKTKPLSLPPDKKIVEPVVKPQPTIPDKEPVNKETRVDNKAAQLQPVKPAGERDYSDIDEADVPFFKKMANESFDKLKPIYQERKKLLNDVKQKDEELTKVKTDYDTLRKQGPQLPDTYYEHERAYLLDPQFTQSVAEVSDANTIYNHWLKQLQDVSEGATEFDMLDRNPQNGQLVITGKIKADKAVEAKLMTYVNYAQNALMQKQANMQTLANTHQSKHSDTVKQVNDFITMTFGGLEKPENKPVYDPLIKQEMERFSKFKGNPLLPLAARSLVMNQVLAKLLQQAAESQQKPNANGNQQVQQQQQQRVNSRNAGPTAAEAAGDGGISKGGNGKEDVSMDDFKRAKNGY